MYNYYTFKNNVTVVNTTPHPITMQDMDGALVSIPCDVDYLLNASARETQVDSLRVTTKFIPSEKGKQLIDRIKRELSQEGKTLIIVGSMIAAQAYPGEVSGLCPVPGFERVAPSEKRMRCDKFIVLR